MVRSTGGRRSGLSRVLNTGRKAAWIVGGDDRGSLQGEVFTIRQRSGGGPLTQRRRDAEKCKFPEEPEVTEKPKGKFRAPPPVRRVGYMQALRIGGPEALTDPFTCLRHAGSAKSRAIARVGNAGECEWLSQHYCLEMVAINCLNRPRFCSWSELEVPEHITTIPPRLIACRYNMIGASFNFP